MNLKKFTKKKLEEIGINYGLELDLRHNKEKLIDLCKKYGGRVMKKDN